MRKSLKFIIILLALGIAFSIVCGVLVSAELNSVRENSNNTVSGIVEAVKEKYPNISDEEIAEILNSNTKSKTAENTLERYGITNDDWWIFANSDAEWVVIITAVAVCIASCCGFIVVFIIYNRQRKKEIDFITRYVLKINRGDYSLLIEENQEDEASLLRNEIYKTTVTLREQAENSQKDKVKLKESLQDISHQLKTPLTSIIILLDNILEDDSMPEEIRREFLNDIRRCTGTISFLVQSLLTISKLDANSIAMKSKKENVWEILNQCVNSTAVLAEIKNVEVINNCQEDVKIICDKRWLVEAITNIVKNSIEHTKEGGRVALTAQENRLYTKITIADNGVGIDEKDLPHIFERFYKGKNSAETSVGIGLALAKTIIEKNGGFISVTSQVGKGTTFVVKYFHNNK